MHIRLQSALIPLLLACVPALLHARQETQGKPAEVMILGMYHFANPGKDVVKTDFKDILTDEGQRQLEEVLSRIESFKPTKIAIEAMPAQQARFDSLYAAFLDGTHTLTRNERQQIGFRIAKRRGLPGLYCIDHAADLPFNEYLEYAQEHAPDVVKDFQATIARFTAVFDSLSRHGTVLQILRLMNSPGWMKTDHQVYVDMARVGEPDQDVGPNVLSTWYDRNIHIFGNLARIVEPNDRVLVIYGGGHATILREFVKASGAMTLVDASEYLK